MKYKTSSNVMSKAKQKTKVENKETGKYHTCNSSSLDWLWAIKMLIIPKFNKIELYINALIGYLKLFWDIITNEIVNNNTVNTINWKFVIGNWKQIPCFCRLSFIHGAYQKSQHNLDF